MRRLGLLAILTVLCPCAIPAAAKQRNDGYILHLNEMTRISSLDLQTLLAVNDSVRGPVLWVQRDGRRYEIRDPAILDRAAAAVGPVTKTREEYKSARRRCRSVYEEEEDLDREIDAIEESAEDGGRPDEARLAELRAKRRALAPRLRAAEAEDRELDARQEAAEAAFERALDGLIDEAMRKGLARRVG